MFAGMHFCVNNAGWGTAAELYSFDTAVNENGGVLHIVRHPFQLERWVNCVVTASETKDSNCLQRIADASCRPLLFASWVRQVVNSGKFTKPVVGRDVIVPTDYNGPLLCCDAMELSMGFFEARARSAVRDFDGAPEGASHAGAPPGAGSGAASSASPGQRSSSMRGEQDEYSADIELHERGRGSARPGDKRRRNGIGTNTAAEDTSNNSSNNSSVAQGLGAPVRAIPAQPPVRGYVTGTATAGAWGGESQGQVHQVSPTWGRGQAVGHGTGSQSQFMFMDGLHEAQVGTYGTYGMEGMEGSDAVPGAAGKGSEKRVTWHGQAAHSAGAVEGEQAIRAGKEVDTPLPGNKLTDTGMDTQPPPLDNDFWAELGVGSAQGGGPAEDKDSTDPEDSPTPAEQPGPKPVPSRSAGDAEPGSLSPIQPPGTVRRGHMSQGASGDTSAIMLYLRSQPYTGAEGVSAAVVAAPTSASKGRVRVGAGVASPLPSSQADVAEGVQSVPTAPIGARSSGSSSLRSVSTGGTAKDAHSAPTPPVSRRKRGALNMANPPQRTPGDGNGAGRLTSDMDIHMDMDAGDAGDMGYEEESEFVDEVFGMSQAPTSPPLKTSKGSSIGRRGRPAGMAAAPIMMHKPEDEAVEEVVEMLEEAFLALDKALEVTQVKAPGRSPASGSAVRSPAPASGQKSIESALRSPAPASGQKSIESALRSPAPASGQKSIGSAVRSPAPASGQKSIGSAGHRDVGRGAGTGAGAGSLSTLRPVSNSSTGGLANGDTSGGSGSSGVTMPSTSPDAAVPSPAASFFSLPAPVRIPRAPRVVVEVEEEEEEVPKEIEEKVKVDEMLSWAARGGLKSVMHPVAETEDVCSDLTLSTTRKVHFT